MRFEPVRKIRAAVQVANAIKRLVVDGALQPGDSLPSERELAREMGVNRSTIREALHRLEATGLVQIRQGGATRVNDFLVTAGLQILPLLVAPHGKPDGRLLQDLMEIRTMLLCWTARLVARAQARKPGLVEQSRLPAIVETLRSESEPARLQVLDFDLFAEMVRLSGNRVLRLMIQPVREVYLKNRAFFVEALYHPDRFDARFHRRALRAMLEGDETAAAAAMEDYGRTALFIDRAPPLQTGEE